MFDDFELEENGDDFDFEADDNFEFGEDESMESGGENEEEVKEPDVLYFLAKTKAKEDREAALEMFAKIPEVDRGEWGMKALKRTCYILCEMGRFAEMHGKLCEMLGFALHSSVVEKCVFGVVDEVVEKCRDVAFVESVFAVVSEALLRMKHQRLWFRANMMLANFLFEKCPNKCAAVVDMLKSSAEDTRGSGLLEVYALKILLALRNERTVANELELSLLAESALALDCSLCRPKTEGIIMECAGHAAMRRKDYENARKYFFNSFKRLDEAANARRLNVLCALTVATIFTGKKLNPFQTPETKAYIDNPDIVPLAHLWNLFESERFKDVRAAVLSNGDLLGKADLGRYTADLLEQVARCGIMSAVCGYNRVRLSFLADEVGLTLDECRTLVHTMILDRSINGLINDEEGTLVLVDKNENGCEEPIVALMAQLASTAEANIL